MINSRYILLNEPPFVVSRPEKSICCNFLLVSSSLGDPGQELFFKACVQKVISYIIGENCGGTDFQMGVGTRWPEESERKVCSGVGDHIPMKRQKKNKDVLCSRLVSNSWTYYTFLWSVYPKVVTMMKAITNTNRYIVYVWPFIILTKMHVTLLNRTEIKIS